MPGFGVLSTVLLEQPGGPETMRLRQPAAAAELVVATEQALGPVDILIANARIGRVRPLEEVSVAEFDETVAVNGKTLRGSARQGHQLHLLPAWSSRPMPGTPSATTPASWSTAAPTTCWSSGQPASLHAQLAGLPWRTIPVMDRTRDHGHGRIELRTLKVAAVAGCASRAAQAIQVTRRVRAPAAAAGAPSPCTPSPAWPWAAPARPSWPAGCVGTGGSRTSCTGSARWTSPKTPPPRAPAAFPARWPACATSPSAPCGWPAIPTSPARYDMPARTPPGRLPSSAWHTDETDITALSQSPQPQRAPGHRLE
jgi:hypothetical protein